MTPIPVSCSWLNIVPARSSAVPPAILAAWGFCYSLAFMEGVLITREEPVPIIPLLQGRAFGPEEIKIMSTAFQAALNALGSMDRADPLNELVAKKIIEIARTGERNPGRLRDRALKSLQS
jgi:hypothetical protein